MNALHVAIHAGEIPAGLQELADGPQGSFFHGLAWLEALQRAVPRYRPFVVAASDASGSLQAALPFVSVSRFGLLRLYAGALGTYGGVLSRTPDAARALLQGIEPLLRSPRLLLVRVHDFSGGVEATCGTAVRWRRTLETTQVLDLVEDPQVLFRDAFTSQNRNKIRKAEKEGPHVRSARDPEALGRYARLYAASARRLRLRRPLPEALFPALAGLAGVDVWLAERHGETLAALLNLRGGGQIMNWGNVSQPEAWEFAPNNLLHWRAIEAACLDRKGPRLYNFGASAGLPGVHAFKAAFGARECSYTRLEHVAPWAAWLLRAAGA